MTKTELNKFKEVLETKQAELAQVLRNRARRVEQLSKV